MKLVVDNMQNVCWLSLNRLSTFAFQFGRIITVRAGWPYFNQVELHACPADTTAGSPRLKVKAVVPKVEGEHEGSEFEIIIEFRPDATVCDIKGQAYNTPPDDASLMIARAFAYAIPGRYE